MKTYNTYQEAKIANPECEVAVVTKVDECTPALGLFIAVLRGNSGGDGYSFADENKKGTPNITSGYYTICNPADYCVTVKEFFGSGNEFVCGDISLYDGVVMVVEIPYFHNARGDDDGERLVLRAAALEGKGEPRTSPKLHYTIDKPFLQAGEDYEHTKTLNFIRDRLVEVHGEPKNLDYMHKLNNAIAFVERVEEDKVSNDGFEPVAIKVAHTDKGKCSISEKVDESLLDINMERPKRTKVEVVKVHNSEAIKEVMNGSKEYWCKSGESYVMLDMDSPLEQFCRAFLRLETEITEREAFIVELAVMGEKTGITNTGLERLAGVLFDSGKFKLTD